MQTRRDQVQAHSFVVGRLVSAMLRAEPDTPLTPQRRFVVGWVCGIVAGVLLVAACGVYGVLVPGGNTSWQEPGVLIVEKETGTRYVYVDQQLRPVANFASARLILGGEPTIVQVSRDSLSGVPHGLTIGIVSAPDSLPDVTRLDGTHWLVCSSLRTDASGVGQPFVTAWVGRTLTGDAVGDDRAVVVRTPTGELFLAWHNVRLRMASASVLNALGYAAAPQYPVGWAWINVVPAGPDLVAPEVPGRGQPGPVIDGRRTTVGQLFTLSATTGAAGQSYVVRTDGLSPVSATGLALLLADPRTRLAYPSSPVAPLPLTAAALATGPLSRDRSINPQHPPSPPMVTDVGAGRAPCVQVDLDAAKGPQARIAVGNAPAADDTPPALATRDRRLADRVVVEPGAGLLMRDQAAPGVADGTLHLLTDTGVRYPLSSADVAGVLGYGGVAPMPVPAELLDLIPAGNLLDPVAARATVPAGQPASTPGKEEPLTTSG